MAFRILEDSGIPLYFTIFFGFGLKMQHAAGMHGILPTAVA